jgi:hypothetical protein
MAKETVQIERKTYERLVAQNQSGHQAQKQLQNRDGENVVNAAIAAGKVSPQNADYWRREYERDPRGTAQTIASLAPGPVWPSQQQQSEQQEAAAALAAARDFIPELRGRRISGQSRERRERRAANIERQPLPSEPAAAASVPFPGAALEEDAGHMPSESVEAMFPEVRKRKAGRAAGAWQRPPVR